MKTRKDMDNTIKLAFVITLVFSMTILICVKNRAVWAICSMLIPCMISCILSTVCQSIKLIHILKKGNNTNEK